MKIIRTILCTGRECDLGELVKKFEPWSSVRLVHSRHQAQSIMEREEVDCALVDMTTTSWNPSVLINPLVDKVVPVIAVSSREADISPIGAFKKGVLDFLYAEEVTRQSLRRDVRNALAKNNRKRELLAKQKELEDFAYVASHDLNAPLYKIRQCCDLLIELFEKDLPEKAHRLLNIVERSCVQMNDLINDLLDYSRISRLGKSFKEIPLERVVNEVVAQVKDHFADRNAEFEVGELPAVYANGVAMQQLFYNLLSNAVKYNESDCARITVRAKDDSEAEFISIEVLDNGIGIEPKYQDRIFNPFERLHAQGEVPGSGLGLAICKRIASHHGGTIWHRSNEEGGSVFCIRLSKDPEATFAV